MLRHQRGVTLLELMIVVVIIGILASVALPSYQSYISTGNRTEAQRELYRLANLQEQYFADHKTYTTDMTKLGLSADPYKTETGYYSLDTAAVSDIKTDFIITATALGKQASNDAKCKKLTLDSVGQKAASDGTNSTTSECWI